MNYEEMHALNAGVRAVLGGPTGAVAVAAPPEERAWVQALPPLEGDLSVSTLLEAQALENGVETVVSALRVAMDRDIVSSHPASESAVASYFEYAHAVAFLARIRGMKEEMEALIEVVTGSRPDDEAARSFAFPD